jgi:putative ABC transport system substrate-binding protein
MVLYPRQSGFLASTSRAVTGASLDVPLDTQFDYLHRLLPEARSVGVLYSASETGTIVEAARKAAPAHGLTLVAEPVAEAGSAMSALAALMERVDVVWTVADSHVLTPQSTSALVLASLRRRIPMIGLSTAHVRAGTLAALSCDYADVGRQTGEIVLRSLRGEKPENIPVSTPRTITLALNLRSASHLGVSIPPALEAEATEVVR